MATATRALDCTHGPIHAECGSTPAAFTSWKWPARQSAASAPAHCTSKDLADASASRKLLLRHALGEPATGWVREADASGVMMIPIPRAGIYRRVEGVEGARAVQGIDAVEITAKPDQQLVPLPEGASYLGFIFASGETSEEVEAALRAAHARLAFTIDREIPVL